MIERYLWLRSGRPGPGPAREAAWVKSMGKLSHHFAGVIICAPARVDCLHRGLGELPDSHLKLIGAAKINGLMVVHMRELWSRLRLQHTEWGNSSHYAYALGQIRGEASALGCSMCGLDCEPNDDIGGSTLERWKERPLDPVEYEIFSMTIRQFVLDRRCDLVYPSNSNRGQFAYQNAMRQLGTMGVPSTTVLNQASHPNLTGCWHSQIRPLGAVTDPQAITWQEAFALPMPPGIKAHSMWMEQGRICELCDQLEEADA